MKFRLMRPNMAIRKKRIKLSREVVHDLKEVSKLSSSKQWEFAGNIKYKNFNLVNQISLHQKNETVLKVPKLIEFGILKCHFIHTQVLVIMMGLYVRIHQYSQLSPVMRILKHISKGFPEMQVNIICDSHGYYVINILKSAYMRASPLPEAVHEYMRKVRSKPFMRICVFSDNGIEYFQTTVKNWKREINEYIDPEMMKLFGVSIRYYGYDDDPPIVTVYRDIDVV